MPGICRRFFPLRDGDIKAALAQAVARDASSRIKGMAWLMLNYIPAEFMFTPQQRAHAMQDAYSASNAILETSPDGTDGTDGTAGTDGTNSKMGTDTAKTCAKSTRARKVDSVAEKHAPASGCVIGIRKSNTKSRYVGELVCGMPIARACSIQPQPSPSRQGIAACIRIPDNPSAASQESTQSHEHSTWVDDEEVAPQQLAQDGLLLPQHGPRARRSQPCMHLEYTSSFISMCVCVCVCVCIAMVGIGVLAAFSTAWNPASLLDSTPETAVLLARICLGVAGLAAADWVLRACGDPHGSRRYFVLHVVVNAMVTVSHLPDVMAVLARPLDNGFVGPSNMMPACDACALHIFHVVTAWRTLSGIDWAHHLVSAFGSMYLACCVFHQGSIVGATLFLMCGLPGGIDYAMLAAVRYGYMERLTEKWLNSLLHAYLRAPGLVAICAITYTARAQGYIGHVPWATVFIVMGTTALNAVFFAHRVAENRGASEARAMLEVRRFAAVQ
jgi:hypothetical protein